jgi:hypothetical protein
MYLSADRKGTQRSYLRNVHAIPQQLHKAEAFFEKLIVGHLAKKRWNSWSS